MRVAHIVSSLRGGAGIATRRLSDALNAIAVESAIVCRSGAPDAPDAIVVDGQHIDRADAAMQRIAWLFEDAVQNAYIAPSRSNKTSTLFTLDYVGIPIAHQDVIAKADIINLHWTSFFQSIDTLADLFALGKPIVWTMHDMNPFTGGCHYSSGCARFVETCAQCPQLNGDPAGAAIAHLAERKAICGNAPHLAVVAPSVWLAGEARRSAVLSGARIETIANCVDPGVFGPDCRAAARCRLGFTDQTVGIGFAPLDRSERRKGFVELEAALSIVADRTKGMDVRLVVFGNDADTAKFAFPTIGVATVEREADVAAVLSGCDISITPSLEDNLPNTILEAMACGVPVVAFDVGGARDAIVDGECGALAAAGDTAALAEKLVALVRDSAKRQQMGQAARRRAEDLFSPRRQAAAYRALYLSLTKEKAPTRPAKAGVISTNVPNEVLAAAWPTYVSYVASAHEAALVQIERNQSWAETTEENLVVARERETAFEDWAKRSDATLEETKTLLEEARRWAITSDKELAKQSARADEMEKWARKSDNALAQRNAELQEALAYATSNDAALAECQGLVNELKGWAEGAEARLGEAIAAGDAARAERDSARAELAALQVHQRVSVAALIAHQSERAELEARLREHIASLTTLEAELNRVSWKRRWARWKRVINPRRG